MSNAESDELMILVTEVTEYFIKEISSWLDGDYFECNYSYRTIGDVNRTGSITVLINSRSAPAVLCQNVPKQVAQWCLDNAKYKRELLIQGE